MTTRRPCIDCGTLAAGTRCPPHQQQRTTAKRTAYTHPDYVAMKRHLTRTWVPCWCGCGERATTPDHIVPIIAGGAHDASNLRPAAAGCNYGRGGGWATNGR